MNKRTVLALVIMLGISVAWITAVVVKHKKEANQEETASTSASWQGKKGGQKREFFVQVSSFEATEKAVIEIANGHTEAYRDVYVTLASGVKGTVHKILVAEGEAVKKGQVLLSITPDPGMSEDLQSARSALQDARINLKTNQELFQEGYVSETTLLKVRGTFERAQASAKKMEETIRDLKPKAPFDGYLESLEVDIGQSVGGGLKVGRVVDMEPLYFVGFVSQHSVQKLHVGLSAQVETAQGDTRQGKIVFISNVASPNSRTFEVKITIENKDSSIRAGVAAQAHMVTGFEKAHLIKAGYLTLNAEGQLGVRTVDEEQLVVFYPIEILEDTANGIWVTGLPSTVMVITQGQEMVLEGERVNIQHLNP